MSAIKLSRYTLGPLIAQFVSLSCLPIYTRVYSQKTIGDFQVISTYVLFLMPFVTFGFNSLIVRKLEIDTVLMAFMTWLVPSSIFATLLLTLLSHFVGYDTNYLTIAIICLYVIASALLVVFYQYTVRLEDSYRYAASFLVSSCASTIAKIVFGLYIDEVSSILLAFALSGFLVVFLLGREVSFICNLRVNFGEARYLLSRNLRFQSQVSLAQLIGVATEWVGVAALPFLGFSSSLIAVAGVSQLIARSAIYPFGNALYNVLVIRIQDSSMSFLNVIKIAAPVVLVASGLFSILVEKYGKFVFETVLGNDWGDVASITLSLSIGTYAVIFLQPMARSIAVGLNETSAMLHLEAIGLLCTVIVIYFCNLYEVSLECYFGWISLMFLMLSIIKVIVLLPKIKNDYIKP